LRQEKKKTSVYSFGFLLQSNLIGTHILSTKKNAKQVSHLRKQQAVAREIDAGILTPCFQQGRKREKTSSMSVPGLACNIDKGQELTHCSLRFDCKKQPVSKIMEKTRYRDTREKVAIRTH
jgi:hypothetical protein